jgi:hypothetical protein
LHWGEEVEYSILYFDSADEHAQLMSNAYSLIQEFNSEVNHKDIKLLPEFGNWMVEAVPKDPYNATHNLDDLLGSYEKLL